MKFSVAGRSSARTKVRDDGRFPGGPNHMSLQSMNESERQLLLRRSLARWENEGGAAVYGPQQDVHVAQTGPGVPPLTNAELVQLQVRVIALENLVIALLSGAAAGQRLLATEMAACISPREGFTQHSLTVHAAAQMNHMLARSKLFADAGLA